MLHKESVETETLDLIHILMADRALSGFNLVGGTSLALMMGHRKSIDIDLFTDRDFDAASLEKHLSLSYNVDRLNRSGNNIWCIINGIKVDLIAHQYPILKPVEAVEGIRMLSMEDIGAMKIHAIFQSGTRLKDFVDMHFLLEKMPLQQITKGYIEKYPGVNVAMAHLALSFHDDINLRNKIDFLGKDIPFPVIAARLQQAMLNPAMIFKNTLNEKASEDIAKENKNGLRKGRGRRM